MRIQNKIKRQLVVIFILLSALNAASALPESKSKVITYKSEYFKTAQGATVSLRLSFSYNFPQVAQIQTEEIISSANYYGDSDAEKKCLVSSRFSPGNISIELVDIENKIVLSRKMPVTNSIGHAIAWQGANHCNNEIYYLNNPGFDFLLRSTSYARLTNEHVIDLNGYSVAFEGGNGFQSRLVSWFHYDIHALVIYDMSLPSSFTINFYSYFPSSYGMNRLSLHMVGQ